MDTTRVFVSLHTAEAFGQVAATCYPFTSEEVERVVERRSPGTFALGSVNRDGRFIIGAVGRSDDDVADELQVRYLLRMGAGLGSNQVPPFTHFTFRYAASPEEAFENECVDYHKAFADLEDKRHPRRDDPAGQRSFCPFWQCAWNY